MDNNNIFNNTTYAPVCMFIFQQQQCLFKYFLSMRVALIVECDGSREERSPQRQKRSSAVLPVKNTIIRVCSDLFNKSSLCNKSRMHLLNLPSLRQRICALKNFRFPPPLIINQIPESASCTLCYCRWGSVQHWHIVRELTDCQVTIGCAVRKVNRLNYEKEQSQNGSLLDTCVNMQYQALTCCGWFVNPQHQCLVGKLKWLMSSPEGGGS